MPRYSAVSARAGFPDAELEILDLWQRTRVFERSLEMRRAAPPYVFYEGPPTANGLPGLHHVLARSYKDVFARYKQMTGFSVERKAGWDTHGLPVELEVERALKISGKKQIEEYGIAEFNARCKTSVNEYIDEWREMSERLGFWLDFDHPYRTYDGTYIESVWWSLKELWEDDLLYQGYKVTPYCPRCQTTLSSHELSQGYREDTPDPSVYVKFRLNDSDGTTFLLAWTTTPWTLPGNVALAVHPGKTYVRVAQGDESYILAKQRLEVLEGDYEILDEMHGSDLVDRTYEPLFTDMLPEGLAFVVLDAPELVSMDEGTGIVHTAAAYGVADLELCQRKGVTVRHVVGLDGRFLDGMTRYRGMFVKDADSKIIEDLREQGNLYRAERILHTYPFCWRCDTPLLYYAVTSWFIRTTAVKDRLITHNRSVHWQPAHIRDGRMGNWLESLIDWNLSRSRYWGTPLPIWVCEECDQRVCVGSAAEIGLTAADDLHRPFIDDVTLPCTACKGVMRRVPDVIDCWYDSGAMPFAQKHYPFENKERFESTHPADFICEGVDQTRGWFFSLLAESVLLFDSPAYKNCVVVGTLLDRQGKKMSKSRKNVIEPSSIFDQFGADAARWYFYAPGRGERRAAREPGVVPGRRPPVHADALERVLVLRDVRADRGLRPRDRGARRPRTPGPRPLVPVPPGGDGRRGSRGDGAVRRVGCVQGRRGIRRGPVEVVRAPLAPQVLEEHRDRRGHAGRVRDAVHGAGHALRSRGPVHALHRRADVSQSHRFQRRPAADAGRARTRCTSPTTRRLRARGVTRTCSSR